MGPPPSATVTELWRYPVKSMGGGAVGQVELTDGGVVGDRGYAVVDRVDGKVASAKQPRKWRGLLHLEAAYVEPPVPGEELPPVTVTFPDGSSARSDRAGLDGALSSYLGRDVAVTSVVPDGATFEEVWPDIAGLAPSSFIDATITGRSQAGEAISSIELGSLAPGSFKDVAPLHLLTESTLSELARLSPGVDYDRRRYRPNIVLRTPDVGFVENTWVGGTLRAGSCEITVTLATMRCVMTTLSQPGLTHDRESLRGIARHNRVEIRGLGTWACAGVYAGVNGAGTIAVGDEVELPA